MNARQLGRSYPDHHPFFGTTKNVKVNQKRREGKRKERGGALLETQELRGMKRFSRVALGRGCGTAAGSYVLSTLQRDSVRTYYNFYSFRNAARVPQLTPEQRAKVVINQEEWPEEFRNFDPMNPYEHCPDWIDLSSFNLFMAGVEFAFIITFWDWFFLDWSFNLPWRRI